MDVVSLLPDSTCDESIHCEASNQRYVIEYVGYDTYLDCSDSSNCFVESDLYICNRYSERIRNYCRVEEGEHE